MADFIVPFVRKLFDLSKALLLTYLSCTLICIILLKSLVIILPKYQQNICSWLEKKLDTNIVIQNFNLNWRQGYLSIKVNNLQITGNDNPPALDIENLELELNLLHLFLYWKIDYNLAHIQNMTLNLENSGGESWNLQGVKALSKSWGSDHTYKYSKILADIFKPRINIKNAVINLKKNSVVSSIEISRISVHDDADEKQLHANIKIDDGIIDVSGQAIKNNSNLYWQGNLKILNLSAQFVANLIGYRSQFANNSKLAINSNWILREDSFTSKGKIFLKNNFDFNNSTENIAITSNFFYQAYSVSQFNLWLDQLCYNYDAHNPCDLNTNVFISNNSTYKNSFIFTATELELTKIAGITENFYFIDQKYLDLIRDFNPRGTLKNFYFSFAYLSNDKDKLMITTDVHNLGINDTRDIPELENVSGMLKFTNTSGYMHINSNNFSLKLPYIYDHSLNYSKAKAKLNWNIENNLVVLKIDDINLTGDNEQIKGKLKLKIPQKSPLPPHLSLILSTKNTTLDILPKYLPNEGIITAKLNNWLQKSLHNASVKQLTYLYHGNTNKDSSVQWRLMSTFNYLTLDVPNSWPPLTKMQGKVSINNNLVTITGKNATMVDNDIYDMEATIKLSENNPLKINAKIQSKDENILKLINNIPTNKIVKLNEKTFKLDGIVDSEINISMPLKNNNDDALVDVKSNIHNVCINDSLHNIQIKRINGVVNYSTFRGFNADQLSGYFLNEKFVSELKSTIENDTRDIKTVSGSCKSQLSIKDLEDLINIPIKNTVSGKTNYFATWDFYPEKKENYFTIETNLVGLQSILPKPFYKTSEDESELSINWLIDGDNNHHIKATIDNENTLNINTKQQHNDFKNSISIKTISGFITEVDLKQWLDLFLNGSSKKNYFENITLDNLNIAKIQYNDIKLKDIYLLSEDKATHNAININSDLITGTIELPKTKHYPLILDFKKIILQTESSLTSTNIDYLKNKLKNLDWSIIPETKVKIDVLNYMKHEIKNLKFNLLFRGKALSLTNFNIDIESTNINGFADWIKTDSMENCWIQGNIKSNSKNSLVSNILQEKGILNSNKVNLDFALGWKGMPLDIEKNNVQGYLDINFKDGKIKKIEKNAQILKPFGLFNADSLVKRLRLDFSDLFSSGYSFDSINGKCILSYGKIYTYGSIAIIGSSASNKLTGMIDINSNKLDLDLVITLPIISNLPIISLFLAANPMLSILIFIADKAIGKQINALANINYRIYGPTDNPKIVLKRLFK